MHWIVPTAPPPPHVKEWAKQKNLNYASNEFFSKMVSIILGSPFQADVCSDVHFSNKYALS